MADLSEETRDILASVLEGLKLDVDDAQFNVKYMSTPVAKDSLGSLRAKMEVALIIIEEKGLTI